MEAEKKGEVPDKGRKESSELEGGKDESKPDTPEDKKHRHAHYWDNMPQHEFVFDPVTMKMPHPIYKGDSISDVPLVHPKPKTLGDKWAEILVQIFRLGFDKTTRYSETDMTELRWFRRVIFLETIAGVPGFVGGMCRHLKTLRSLKRDGGWINHLLGEAENERMHLLTFMHERNPGFWFKLFVLAGQGVFMNVYFISYLLSPKTCHRFVGYLEDQAIKTYTHLLRDIDDEKGVMKAWGEGLCTMEARQYWQLHDKATWRDVVLAIRADEAVHRDFNHYLADNYHTKDLRICHKPVVINSPFKNIYGGNKEFEE